MSGKSVKFSLRSHYFLVELRTKFTERGKRASEVHHMSFVDLAPICWQSYLTENFVDKLILLITPGVLRHQGFHVSTAKARNN